MGTRILLAGAENPDLMDTLIRNKARFVLLSFHYLQQKWGKDMERLKESLQTFEFVMIDSGAFTLFTKHSLSYSDIEKYAQEYAEWLAEFKEYITVAVELDLYEMEAVGLRSHDIRKQILEPTGVTILPVFHGDVIPRNKQSREDWIDFCKEYKYVGVASRMIEKGQAKVTALVTEAAKWGTVCHAFGITKQDYIKNSRFYTVDSTAWTNGQRFGTHYVFEQNKLRIYDNYHKDNARRRNWKKWERAGIPLDGLENDQTDTFTNLNCWEWVQFQNYVYGAKSRDYWKPELDFNPTRKGKKIEIVGEVKETVPVIIETMTELLEGVEPDVEYIIWNKRDKQTWTATFDITEDYLEEIRSDGKRFKIYKDFDAVSKEIEKEEKEYNQLLYALFNEGLLQVKKKDDYAMMVQVERPARASMSEAQLLQSLRCNDCYLAGRCSFFLKDQTCAYNEPSRVDNGEALVNNLTKVLGMQFDRVYKGALIEKMDGGVLDKALSEEFSKTFSMAKMLKDLMTDSEEVRITAKGKKGTGVLAELLGARKKNEEQ